MLSPWETLKWLLLCPNHEAFLNEIALILDILALEKWGIDIEIELDYVFWSELTNASNEVVETESVSCIICSEILELVVESHCMNFQVHICACSLIDHLYYIFLNVQYSKAIGFGSLGHDDNGGVLIFAYHSIIFLKFFDTVIDWSTLAFDNFWELDSEGVEDCFKVAERSQTNLLISLDPLDNNLGKNGAVIQNQINPIDEASLIADDNITIKLFDCQLTFLPFGKVKAIIFSMILFLNVVEWCDVHEELWYQFIVESLH